MYGPERRGLTRLARAYFDVDHRGLATSTRLPDAVALVALSIGPFDITLELRMNHPVETFGSRFDTWAVS